MYTQIKPLTEEEKKQKLAELKEKMAVKRVVKAKEDAKETLANEAIRRKAGKVCAHRVAISHVHPVDWRLSGGPCSFATGHQHTPGGDATEGAPEGG